MDEQAQGQTTDAPASSSPAPVVAEGQKPFIVSPTPVIPATPQEPEESFYQKKDLFIAGAIGLVCALLILPIAENLAIDISYAYALVIVLPFLSVAGMLIASWLAKKLKFIYQVAKFILVGLLNTFVDWGILNLLMFLTSTVSGALFPVFKGISFLIATSNSYAWNKFWTFTKSSIGTKTIEEKTAGKEFLQFFIVSLVGFLLNVGIATLVVNVWGAPENISQQLWANIGALGGTLAGLAWNFLGYKLIVFKS
jgi:putative flippase GtrA